ncbi:Cytochrome c6 [Acaryochloris thomasi RCC1774]|uniref:Cytochrome c6 n=2 Tax=Acaryochloris TaxID=155977 RepID=A0A2W1JNT7_9CYAN|nr:Cytochrome c6 [Acaryochloris thomasi RCC1774]
MRGFFSLMLIVIMGLTSAPALAISSSPGGAELFEVHCVGCHPQGKNIIRRGKTLRKKALQKNKVDSLDAIATLVTNGKGNMSAYADKLSAPEIETVSAYVLEQAEQGWH